MTVLRRKKITQQSPEKPFASQVTSPRGALGSERVKDLTARWYGSPILWTDIAGDPSGIYCVNFFPAQ